MLMIELLLLYSIYEVQVLRNIGSNTEIISQKSIKRLTLTTFALSMGIIFTVLFRYSFILLIVLPYIQADNLNLLGIFAICFSFIYSISLSSLWLNFKNIYDYPKEKIIQMIETKRKQKQTEQKHFEQEAKQRQEYYGTSLYKPESEYLQALEEQLGKPIPVQKEIGPASFGFMARANHIIELGLDNQGITDLPENLGCLTALQFLHLSGNQISSMPDSLGNLFALKELYMNENQLNNLPENIANLKSLIHLEVNSNQITSLPDNLGKLSALKELDLKENMLNSLPENMRNLKSLKHLDIRLNPLNDLSEIVKKMIRGLQFRGIEVIKD